MESLPLYAEPINSTDQAISNVLFTIKGSKVPVPFNLKYADLLNIRKKLSERFPAVYIPNLPDTSKYKNEDHSHEIKHRTDNINIFLKKISEDEYLIDSTEIQKIIETQGKDINGTLNSFIKMNYQDLLKKYSLSFTDYDENFDTLTEKQAQEKFTKKLNELYLKIKGMRNLLNEYFNRFNQSKNDEINLLKKFISYEKEELKNYFPDQEDKLVLANPSNLQAIEEKIKTMKDNMQNPYYDMYLEFQVHVLDIKALLQALDELGKFQENYEKIIKVLTNTSLALIEAQSGKTTIKSVFSFKSKETLIADLTKQKDDTERDLNSLGQIIKVCTFKLGKKINDFINCRVKNYYVEILRLKNLLEKNKNMSSYVWEEICKNKNITDIQETKSSK